MNLLHLEYFYFVAKEGGFTKASEALRIQQPAISRMVRQLEESLGFKLLEKVGRKSVLTPRGLQTFEHCKRIFGEVDQLKSAALSLRGECQGPLAFGAAEPVASHLIPKFLGPYLENHPRVHPAIFSGPAAVLFERILSGELEFGLFFHVPEAPPQLAVEPVRALPFRLVVKSSLRKDRRVLQSFIGSREIDDTSTRRFPTLERLRAKHPGAKIRISCNNLTAHKEMALLGLGVAILPEFLVAAELKRGVLADVDPKETFEFNLKLVRRRTGVLSLNASEFLKQVESP